MNTRSQSRSTKTDANVQFEKDGQEIVRERTWLAVETWKNDFIPSKCSSGYDAKNPSFCCSSCEKTKSPGQKSYQHLKELLQKQTLIREAVRRVLESQPSTEYDTRCTRAGMQTRRQTKAWSDRCDWRFHGVFLAECLLLAWPLQPSSDVLPCKPEGPGSLSFYWECHQLH